MRRYLHVRGQAAHRVFEADFEIVANIFAALRPRPPAAAAENVPRPKRSPRMSPKSANAVSSKTERPAPFTPDGQAVVGGALLRIAQNA